MKNYLKHVNQYKICIMSNIIHVQLLNLGDGRIRPSPSEEKGRKSCDAQPYLGDLYEWLFFLTTCNDLW